jgi:hypothetical protein
MDQASIKEHAHDLIERIPPAHLQALVGVLEILAPIPARDENGVAYEDEPIGDDENAQAMAANGPWSSLEEVMEELGITRADLERVGEGDGRRSGTR